MQAVEFRSTIDQNTIRVPEQYIKQMGKKVRVILLSDEFSDASARNLERKSEAKGFGMLAHRANPDLWAEEETAYAKAVMEKYADH